MKKLALATIAFLALSGGIGYVATHGMGAAGGGGGVPPQIGAVGGGPVKVVPGDETVLGPVPGQARATAPAASPVTIGGDLSSIGALPAIGPDIVKTAQLSLTVKKGTFDDAFQSATLVARRYGGFVESSSTAGTKSMSGNLLIRVPNASFEQALRDLRGLGDVNSESISGQDLTAQFVDLQARLRTWQAQEAVLLKLMRQATTIEGTLRVQNQLQDVQFRIEQIKGQLRVLQNQVELATIQVGLSEAGAPAPKPLERARPSLIEAWQRSLNGFLGVLYTVVVGLGYLVPISILLAVVVAAFRRLRPAAAGRPNSLS